MSACITSHACSCANETWLARRCASRGDASAAEPLVAHLRAAAPWGLATTVTSYAPERLRSLQRTPWHVAPALRGLPMAEFLRHEWWCVWDEDGEVFPGDPRYGTEMMIERDPETQQRFANVLKSYGVGPGDRVLCLSNGLYGDGFTDFVENYGGEAVLSPGAGPSADRGAKWRGPETGRESRSAAPSTARREGHP